MWFPSISDVLFLFSNLKDPAVEGSSFINVQNSQTPLTLNNVIAKTKPEKCLYRFTDFSKVPS